jgi:hypothetical protein
LALSNLTPYVTPTELLNAPTGIDWTSIPTRNASAASQLAEQTQICWRVTDRIDELAEQVLRATLDTETKRGPDFELTVDQWTGEGVFRTARWPVLAVISGQWTYAASYPPAWTAIAQNQFLVDDVTGYLGATAPGGSGEGSNRIMIAPGVMNWTAGRNGYRVQVTYVNGWPNCGISASGAKPNGPAAADTTIHVDDICGWGVVAGGISGRLYDGSVTEGIMVTSVTPDVANANNGPGLLTLSAGLINAHGLNLRVSAMPSTLQQAALNLATAYARMRGATAIAAQSGKASISSKSNEELMIEAEEIISKYARVI